MLYGRPCLVRSIVLMCRDNVVYGPTLKMVVIALSNRQLFSTYQGYSVGSIGPLNWRFGRAFKRIQLIIGNPLLSTQVVCDRP